MFSPLSADTDLIGAYGSASSAHGAELRAAAARLTALGPVNLGPVGARFQAALTRSAERAAHHVAELSARTAGTGRTARRAAQSYAAVDDEAGMRITGSW